MGAGSRRNLLQEKSAIKELSYLKRLSFIDQNNGMYGSNDSGSGNVNTDNSSNEGGHEKKKKSSNFENEHQIRIGGKLYHMQNEMGLIARQILNKCKFYNNKVYNKK